MTHIPTGDPAHNPGMCPDWESNQRSFGSQAGSQSRATPARANVFFFYSCYLISMPAQLWSVCDLVGFIFLWVPSWAHGLPVENADGSGKVGGKRRHFSFVKFRGAFGRTAAGEERASRWQRGGCTCGSGTVPAGPCFQGSVSWASGAGSSPVLSGSSLPFCSSSPPRLYRDQIPSIKFLRLNYLDWFLFSE